MKTAIRKTGELLPDGYSVYEYTEDGKVIYSGYQSDVYAKVAGRLMAYVEMYSEKFGELSPCS